MFFKKKEEKVFYPFAYDLAESISPMLAREFELWYEKDEQAFQNLVAFFHFLKSNIKLFKKCDKEDLSYYFLISFKKLITPEIKKIIDDLSEELCFNGKINRCLDYYMEELNRINGY